MYHPSFGEKGFYWQPSKECLEKIKNCMFFKLIQAWQLEANNGLCASLATKG